MTSSAPHTTHNPAPLNLAALMATARPIVLPNGKTRQLLWTPQAAELWRTVKHLTAAVQAGETVNDAESDAAIDAMLRIVIDGCTDDDVLCFRDRVDLKLTVLVAASGRVDNIYLALAQQQGAEGNAAAGEASPPSTRDTTSAPS